MKTPLPTIWLVSDARNDAALDRAIGRLPRGSGVIFRHFHLSPREWRARLRTVQALCRKRGDMLVVAGRPARVRRFGASGSYGPPVPRRTLANVHSLRQIGRANAFGANAIVLSPVFATRSHPGAKALGRVRALLLARRARVPVIALGGMTAARFRLLGRTRIIAGWAAIDGLS